MKKLGKVFAIPLTCFVLCTQTAFPCTTFSLNSSAEKIIGKSYDWSDGNGYIMVNKRNVSKTALLVPNLSKPAKWISKFGSITFNQIGRELPMGGMNEAGLVVEVMILSDTRYPQDLNPTPAVNESQWIQYMLDNFSNVGEMLDHADAIKIAPAAQKVHFMGCDRRGDCATFEYLKGNLVTHNKNDFKQFVLTNSTAEESLKKLKKYQGFGGTSPIPDESTSIARFVRTSALIKSYNDSKDTPEYALGILDSIAIKDTTQWNILYESATGKISFRTTLHPTLKDINMSDFDFSCQSKVTMHDIQISQGGDISDQFVPYTREVNRKLFQRAVEVFSLKLPAGFFEKVVAYPELGTRCMNKL